MKFIDNEHKQFYEQKYQELKGLRKEDVYYKSLLYILSMSPITRNFFNEIFDIKNGEINVNVLNASWQTGTSQKVTRMAFNLWNSCVYDSEQDFENEKMSVRYNPNEIFACSYAPYFYEAIKIRFPEYTKQVTYEKEEIEI